ncbi:hypothetical protein [Tellurirhabdus bombi]|uniref:hypothetical protein n=1 Tax=Tellurirhabdus bombi TaxID=2907205 RepID=UPI001F1C52DE|nr:hypothetical protein [Tellurirhabdus bombi]
MQLQDLLRQELNSITNNGQDTHPKAQLYVDTDAIFWVTPSGHYLLIEDHIGINDYIDDAHPVVTITAPEGVGSRGVFWKNKDFVNPYRISTFETQIDKIGAI